MELNFRVTLDAEELVEMNEETTEVELEVEREDESEEENTSETDAREVLEQVRFRIGDIARALTRSVTGLKSIMRMRGMRDIEAELRSALDGLANYGNIAEEFCTPEHSPKMLNAINYASAKVASAVRKLNVEEIKRADAHGRF